MPLVRNVLRDLGYNLNEKPIVAENESPVLPANPDSQIPLSDVNQIVPNSSIDLSKTTIDTLTVNQHIKSGADDYDSGTGWWIGDQDGTPKLFIGDSSGDKITWDGTTLAVSGTLTATDGAIGGWTLTSDTLYSLASGTPTSSPSDGIVIDSTNPQILVYEDTAKRVELGYLSAGVFGLKGYAGDGTTTIFELSDTQQVLAGWSFTDDELTASSGTVGISSAVTGGDDIRFWAGDATPASAPFYVTEAGALVATSATITGELTANTGKIGGSTNYWNITSGSLAAVGSGDVEIRAGQTDYDTGTGFWIGLDAGTAKLSMGDGASNSMTWDGTDLTLNGESTIGGTQTSVLESNANASFQQITIIGNQNDGFTETINGSLERDVMVSALTSTGNATSLDSGDLALFGGTAFVDWDENMEFTAVMKAASTSAGEGAAWGLLQGNFNYTGRTNRHFVFFKDGSTLKASMADGTTQETSTITGITLTNWNEYRIKFTAATSAEFYVNGVLEATLSTNVPSGSSQPPEILIESKRTSGAASVIHYFCNNYTLKANVT
jgi:hypothetical protein